MIIDKANMFDWEWKFYQDKYPKESMQKNYGNQLRREAQKVRNLTVPVTYLNDKGLQELGKIGDVTVSQMNKLLDGSYGWEAPKKFASSLYLKLENHE